MTVQTRPTFWRSQAAYKERRFWQLWLWTSLGFPWREFWIWSWWLFPCWLWLPMLHWCTGPGGHSLQV